MRRKRMRVPFIHVCSVQCVVCCVPALEGTGGNADRHSYGLRERSDRPQAQSSCGERRSPDIPLSSKAFNLKCDTAMMSMPMIPSSITFARRWQSGIVGPRSQTGRWTERDSQLQLAVTPIPSRCDTTRIIAIKCTTLYCTARP
jgi:hypothetical protein